MSKDENNLWNSEAHLIHAVFNDVIWIAVDFFIFLRIRYKSVGRNIWRKWWAIKTVDNWHRILQLSTFRVIKNSATTMKISVHQECKANRMINRGWLMQMHDWRSVDQCDTKTAYISIVSSWSLPMNNDRANKAIKMLWTKPWDLNFYTATNNFK